MKFLKFLVVCAVSTFAMSAAAASTAKATIKITADDSEYADAINIYQDAQSTVKTTDVRNSFNSNYDVQLYVVESSINYMSYTSADLNGVTIKFEANPEETEYTMSFSGVEGDMKLVADSKEYKVANDSTYKLTIAASGDMTFTVSIVKGYPRNIANGSWGTFCYPEAISAVVGADVYKFVGKSDTQVAADKVTSFPLTAGMAYLFHATADAQQFNYTDATQASDTVVNNGLVGTFTGLTCNEGEPYVIKGSSLVPAMPAVVPANRAYIPSLSGITGGIPAPARGRMIFNIANTPTELQNVNANANANGKMIMNGKFIIVKDGKMFNAQGMEL